MRIYMTDGTRTVQMSTRRGENTGLKAAEKTVRRLFHSMPGPQDDKPKPPIGFAGPLDAATERAPEADNQIDEEGAE
ncbi:hypothetical protein [Streptomyces sp. NPDC047981]|uniref:hypothetical protein n=1 Tax=Streptomyces sp. NPDC047981 TaxID=3154610 RepID=UPI003445658B